MSDWIKVTNIPQDFNTKDAAEMFDDIGPIKRMWIGNDEPEFPLSASIQFFSIRNARLAATKKDQMVLRHKTIRIRIIWSTKETLTTVKVTNFPISMTERELEDFFVSYGEIVNLRLCEMPVAVENNESKTEKKEWTALVSYARVDYALSACRELHHSVITDDTDSRGLSVVLLNGDARNLKWKRDRFEFVRCAFPTKKTKGVSAFHCHISRSNNVHNPVEPTYKSPSLSSRCSPTSPCDSLEARIKTHDNSQGNRVPLSQRSPNWSDSDHNTKKWSHSQPQCAINVGNGDSAKQSATTDLRLSHSIGCLEPPVGNNWVSSQPRSPSFSSSYKQDELGVREITGETSTLLMADIVSPAMSTSDVMRMPSTSTDFLSLLPRDNNINAKQALMFPTISQKNVIGSMISNCSGNPLVIMPSDIMRSSPQRITSNIACNLSTLQQSQYQNANSCYSNVNKSSNLEQSKTPSARSEPISVSTASNEKKSKSAPPNWTAEQRKIGDMVYHELKLEFPEKVAKLTGMMLALPKQELDQLVCDKNKLKTKAHQLVKLL